MVYYVDIACKGVMMKKRLLWIGMLASLLHAEVIEYQRYVKVTKSLPTYENVVVREPYQECWTQRVPVTVYDQPHSRYRQDDRTAAAIIGGVAGGILGHQLVHSRKAKGAATIGGAILGTLAGENAARRPHYRAPSHAYTRYESHRECTTRYEEHTRREFRGYKNIGWYKGKKIVKYSDRPLKRIPITVTISY